MPTAPHDDTAIRAAVAANVLSDGAVAYADAAQTTPITQGN